MQHCIAANVSTFMIKYITSSLCNDAILAKPNDKGTALDAG